MTDRADERRDQPRPAPESIPWRLRDLTVGELRDLRDEYEDRYRPDRWTLP